MILPNYMIDPHRPPGATLVYEVEVSIINGTDATGDHVYFIDAKDGGVVWHYNRLQSDGIGNSQYNSTVAFPAIAESGVFRMQDPVRGADPNDALHHGDYAADLQNLDGIAVTEDRILTDADNAWGDGHIFGFANTVENRQTAAVDAFFGMEKTLDYYLMRGRNGIDGANLKIAVGVHYQDHKNNSFWHVPNPNNPADKDYGRFGDGDLVSRGPLVSLDIVGHEVTHGVTGKSARLGFTGEIGAVNESFSDIFGTAVEWYARGQQGQQGNYLLGEDTSLLDPKIGLRNLQDPPAYTYTRSGQTYHYPDHMDKEVDPSDLTFDSGGVHANCTIQDKAFWLLAEGGTHPYSDVQVTGIGRDAAEDIFYKALTGVNLTQNSQLFYHVRQATLAVACAEDPGHNPPYGVNTQACNSTTAAWNAVGVTGNSIDLSRFFVQQQYSDFLNRTPDQSGWDYWTNNIENCTPHPCFDAKRVNTSAAFFLSIEFQQTGYLVERMYKAAYGDTTGTSTYLGSHSVSVPVVRFSEFLPDTQQIGQGVVVGQTGWETQLENNKQNYATQFVQRSRFTSAFPTSMTAAQFVDTLNVNAGNPLSSSERDGLVNDLSNGAKTRAQVLRAVAEDQDLSTAEFNRAFVLMQYFGYLRRNPNDPQDFDYSGYDFWLTKLNQFGGDYNAAEMVKAFINSNEYRGRFGPA